MTTWLRYWPILVFLLGLGMGGVRLLIHHQAQDFLRDERLRILEVIVVSEYPSYTRMIYP